MRRIPSKLFFLIFLAPGIIGAQSMQSIPPADDFFNVVQAFSSQKLDTGPSVKISLSVKDSTLGFVLREISRLSRREVVFIKSDSVFEKRIQVNLKGASLTGAFAQVLKGTGLTASLAPDGTTVVVRNEKGGSSGGATSGQNSKEVGSITGIVVDSASGKGIAGATITLAGTNFSVVTNSEGRFVFRGIPGGSYSLHTKLIGFRTGIAPVDLKGEGSMVTLKIVLSAAATALSEVVTTATGSQRRIEVGNDIVKIDASKILERAPARTVTDIIRQAHVPGVHVVTASGEPGAPSRVRIRGISSITQNTDPVVIVDGIWISSDMSSQNIRNQAMDPSSAGIYGIKDRYTPTGLDQIDPNSIETIEIIKGPSAATLYGPEAANGVIIVTTKKGRYGRTDWSYSYSRDWDNQPRAQYGNWIGLGSNPLSGDIDGVVISCTQQQHISGFCIQDSAVNLHASGGLLDQTAGSINNSHSVSLRGGLSNINYSLSAALQDNLGTDQLVPVNQIRLRKLNVPYSDNLIRPSSERRYNFNGSIGFELNQSLNLQMSFAYNQDDLMQNGVSITGTGNDPRDTLTVLSASNTSVDIQYGGSKSFSLQSGISATYNSNSWWMASGQLGLNRVARTDHLKREMRGCLEGQCNPPLVNDLEGLVRANINTDVYTMRANSSGRIRTKFDRLVSFIPSVGIDVRRNLNEQVRIGLTNVPHGSDNFQGGGLGQISDSDVVTAGYYLNTNIHVLNRLYFDIGIRQDIGSAIKSSNSSRFPKLSTSWLVSDESFFPRISWLDLMRVRAAFGYASILPSEADLSGSYRYGSSVINGRQVIIGQLSSIGNDRLNPERTAEFEVGSDIDLMDSRITLGFTLAHKATKNAIVNREMPTSVGSPVRKENIARVENRSIELSVGMRIVDTDVVQFSLNSNLSNVNNIVKEIGANTTKWSNLERDRIVEGYQIGSLWSRPVLGYGDVDSDGYISTSEILLGDTSVYIGWAMPKFQASFSPSIGLFNSTIRMSASVSHRGKHAQFLRYLDNYGIVDIHAPIDEQAFARSYASGNGMPTSASEWRLNAASIAYTVPTSMISRINARAVTVSLQGSNLGLWTNYRGRDPMVNSNPLGNTIEDNGFTLPMPRRYAVNVRVDL